MVEEFDGGESVVVLGRVPVLRREAVVDGDDDGVESPAESPADSVVAEGGRGEERESAAVEEDNDGKGGAGTARGREEAEPDVFGGVDGDVLGGNAVNRGGVGVGLAVENVVETAVNGAVTTACDVV